MLKEKHGKCYICKKTSWLNNPTFDGFICNRCAKKNPSLVEDYIYKKAQSLRAERPEGLHNYCGREYATIDYWYDDFEQDI